MENIYALLDHELSAGRGAALVTVMGTEGSSPGKAGAAMAVFSGGTAGTVGGGALEHTAQERARALMAAGNTSETLTLSLAAGNDMGMVCGGKASLLIEIFTPEDAPFMRTAAERAGGRAACCYARRLSDGRVAARRLLDGENFDEEFPKEALAAALSGGAGLIEGEPGWFVTGLSAAHRAIIYGGGHVSAELAPLLAKCGFSVTVCDDRAEFADAGRFPGVSRAVLCDYTRLPEEALPGPADFAVVMTHGHEADFEVLRQVLNTAALYVGCIGSRKKAAHTRERLLADGFSAAQADRVRTPVGLAIGAETPAEIAVAIAAEMVGVRAKNDNKI